MASLFVSHSSHDAAETAELASRLRAEGFEALFVDFDPDVGIPAGRNWERELYGQLRRADGVVYLATPASIASRWCAIEVGIARAIGKPVFPILVSGTERLALLADVQWVDLTSDGDEGAYRRLLAGLRQGGLDPADAFAWNPARSPYPGLEPFGSEDAAVFLGRDAEIDRLLQLLQPTLQHAAGRCVGIVGPSGSGKSSLLRAGLLPRLQRLPERWVVLPALRPGQDPLKSLARSLAHTFAARGRSFSSAHLDARLERGPEELVALVGELAEAGSGEPKVLVVIDQAEELVTRTGPRDQQRFLGLVRGALSEASPLWVVATLRSEFLATDPERAGLAGLIDDPLLVEPLGRSHLSEVIARPAQRAGLEFAPGLVERMVEETTGGDALPLLAYTLRELYERVGREGTIGIADYEAVGGVVGALQRHADQVLDELARRGRGELVLPTLLKLASVEGEAEPTRRRLRRSALSPDEQAVAGAFVDARLLTSDSEDHEATIEIAHEALLRRWTPLRRAIEDSRASLRLRSALEREAADWDHSGRDESYLVRGGRLVSYGEWAEEHPLELSQLDLSFLAASRAAAQRSTRRLRRLSVALAILSVAAFTLAAGAFVQRQAARSQARQAKSGELAAQAVNLLSSRPDLSLLLSLESLRLDPTSIDAQAALSARLTRPTHIAKQLVGHTGAVNAVAFSRDGRLLASASVDGTVRLWDGRTGLAVAALHAHRGRVRSIAFSRDGGLLASAGEDGTVRLWDVATRVDKGTVLGGGGPLQAVALSPDGKLVAAAGEDGAVRVRDIVDGKKQGVLGSSPGPVTDVAFSLDGSLLASVDEEGSLQWWDIRTMAAPIRTLAGALDAAYALDFSPDGRTIAVGGRRHADGAIVFVDVMTGSRVRDDLKLHGDVWDVAFSPDGTRVASGGRDSAARVWRTATGAPLGPAFLGHVGEVRSVAFSPDGRHLASGSNDRTIRLWDVETTQSLGAPLGAHSTSINRVAFSPNGRLLASASHDGSVQIWDVARRRPLRTLGGHKGEVMGLAFSADGKLVATGARDATLGLWDVSSGQLSRRIATRGGEILAVAFSPTDPHLLATGADDGVVRLWNASSGRPLGTTVDMAGSVYGVAFSPDGGLLASVDMEGMLELWDVRSHTRERTRAFGDTLWSVAFSPDNKYLATAAEDGDIWLSDATGGRSNELLRGHSSDVFSVAFNRDGTILASAGEDGLRIWTMGPGRPKTIVLDSGPASVNAVAFTTTPGRQLMASGGADGIVRLWVVGTRSWASEACRVANRNLSREEWMYSLGNNTRYLRTCPPSWLNAR